MGLLKIEVNVADIRKEISITIRNPTKIFEDIVKDVQVAVGGVISEFMNAEMKLFLGEPDQVENSRNGYESKEYSFTKELVPLD